MHQDSAAASKITLKGVDVSVGFAHLTYFDKYMTLQQIEICKPTRTTPNETCPDPLFQCDLDEVDNYTCTNSVTLADDGATNPYVFKKPGGIYVENGASLTLSDPAMDTDRWAFEIHVRVYNINVTSPVMEIPTGDVVMLNPANGEFTIDDIVISTCSIDSKKYFVIAMSYNLREEKLTTRICQGSACTATQVFLRNSGGSSSGTTWIYIIRSAQGFSAGPATYPLNATLDGILTQSYLIETEMKISSYSGSN